MKKFILGRARVVALLLVSLLVISASAYANGMNGSVMLDNSKSEASQLQQFSNTNHFDKLMDKGVKKENLDRIHPTDLESLVNQIEALNFTDLQVQQYVEGLLTEKKPTFTGKVRGDGLIETNYGLVPNLLLRHQNIVTSKDKNSNPVEISSYSSDYRSTTDSNDQSGVYWAVKSESGYSEATAFVTLPTLSSIHNNDRPYMFFAANTNPSSIIGDYGVVYVPGTGWVGFRNATYWNGSGYDSEGAWDNGSAFPSSITRVYLHLKVTNTTTTDSVKIRILNADNFSQVLYEDERTYTEINNPINSTLSNLNLYHETTMAQVLSGSSNLNTNTGSWMKNASYNDIYLYNSTGYWLWGTTQTDDAYIKAPITSELDTITVNSYTKWSTDDISIRFNIP